MSMPIISIMLEHMISVSRITSHSKEKYKAKTNQTENIHEISNKCSNNEQLFLNLLELYDLALNKKIDDTAFLKETSNVLNNDDFDGFFNKKTIYKVKK